MAALSPKVEEEDGLTVLVDQDQNTAEKLNLCLIGHFLMRKNIRSKAMKECIAGSWRPGKGVLIKDVEPSLLFFQFYHKIDKNRVVSGGPWNFENHMLILSDIKPGDILNRIPLFHVDISVQVHNLPVGSFSEALGQQLGNYIGVFREYDPKNNSRLWRTYVRIKVRLDVRKPLRKEKKIMMVGGEWRVVSFRYEHLGSFLFLSGLMGHMDRSCEEKLFTAAQNSRVKSWGPELQAVRRWHGEGGGSRWLREHQTRVAIAQIGKDSERHSVTGSAKLVEKTVANNDVGASHITDVANSNQLNHCIYGEKGGTEIGKGKDVNSLNGVTNYWSSLKGTCKTLQGNYFIFPLAINSTTTNLSSMVKDKYVDNVDLILIERKCIHYELG